MNHRRIGFALILGALALAACKRSDTSAGDSASSLDDTVQSAEAFTVLNREAPACAKVPANQIHSLALSEAAVATLTRNGVCAFHIPEKHDEQRLSNGAAGFGSFVRSYAVDDVQNYDDHTDFHGGYRLVAMVEVVGTDLPGPYNALHLVTGWNCVFLTHVDAGGGKWWAQIVPEGPAGCTSGTAAKIVTKSEQPSTNAADYPAVTRWVEGLRLGHSRTPMLGVRCGNEWCNIGPGAPINSAHVGHPDAGTSPRWTIRGWHDDQTLSLPGSPVPTPNGPKLSIVPHDDLGSKTDADFENKSVEVARVIVPTGVVLPAKYGGTAPNTSGFHFRTGVNVIFLQHIKGITGDYWEVEVRNGSNSKTWRKVTPLGHPGWTIPGTARWKWSETDEEIWVRCGVGCCTIQPE